MSRLVIPQPKDPLRSYEAKGAAADRDKYLDRVAKYIPSEAVGVYASLDGVVNPIRDIVRAPDPSLPAGAAPSAAAAGLLTPWSPALVFAIGLVLAFVWVWYLGKKSGNSSWKIQALIAIFAFCVWAYATKGSFFFSNAMLDGMAMQLFGQEHFYNPTGAMVILILFSAIIAFYEPKTDN